MNLFKKNSGLANFFGLEFTEENREDVFEKQFSFGEILKKYRLQTEITSSELSKRSGVSQSYISQLENNLKVPSDPLIEKLSYGLVNHNNYPIGANFNYKFDDDYQKEMFEFYKEKLMAGRDLYKIKNIKIGLTDINDESELYISLFNKLNDNDKNQVIKYMEFLLKESNS